METKAIAVYNVGGWLMHLFVHADSQSNIIKYLIFNVRLGICTQHEILFPHKPHLWFCDVY